MPATSSPCDRLIAVWPPNCTIVGVSAPSPFSLGGNDIPDSFSMMSRTDSSSSGSKYRRSDVSKSVETVSGFEFTITAATPPRCNAHAAWTEQ